MDVQELLERAREGMDGQRVYGEPHEADGITVIPAASVRGGAGGGSGPADEGGGGGFGLVAKPAGAWIIKDGEVSWKPAVDPNRIVLGGQIVAVVALLTLGRILAARAGR
jgi:uncharacterized spore protein YtfJ